MDPTLVFLLSLGGITFTAVMIHCLKPSKWQLIAYPGATESGPHTHAELHLLNAAGRLQPGAMVRRLDQQRWHCAFETLRDQLAVAPDPAKANPPPVPVAAAPVESMKGHHIASFSLCAASLIGLVVVMTRDTAAPGTNITNLSLQHQQTLWTIICLAGLLIGVLVGLLGGKKTA